MRKLGESGVLECASPNCPWLRKINREHDIVFITYRRGMLVDILTRPFFAQSDSVEIYHVDCLPEGLRAKLEKGGM